MVESTSVRKDRLDVERDNQALEEEKKNAVDDTEPKHEENISERTDSSEDSQGA